MRKSSTWHGMPFQKLYVQPFAAANDYYSYEPSTMQPQCTVTSPVSQRYPCHCIVLHFIVLPHKLHCTAGYTNFHTPQASQANRRLGNQPNQHGAAPPNAGMHNALPIPNESHQQSHGGPSSIGHIHTPITPPTSLDWRCLPVHYACTTCASGMAMTPPKGQHSNPKSTLPALRNIDATHAGMSYQTIIIICILPDQQLSSVS